MLLKILIVTIRCAFLYVFFAGAELSAAEVSKIDLLKEEYMKSLLTGFHEGKEIIQYSNYLLINKCVAGRDQVNIGKLVDEVGGTWEIKVATFRLGSVVSIMSLETNDMEVLCYFDNEGVPLKAQ